MQVVLVANSTVLPIVNFTIESIYEHLENINPIVHIVIPAVEKNAFNQKITPEVHVIHEEDLLNNWTKDRISKFPVVGFPARTGWYLQQFLKMGFAQYTKDADYLIWDADTIILKPIKIKNGNKYVFYSSTERHDEYFDTFYALTGMTTASKVSFIAQGMPINVEWMLELLRRIEQRAGHHWIEAILRSLRGKSRSQFSEYETYGNYVANMYPEYMEINKNHWFRYGTSLLGMPPSKKKLKSLSSLYDYVAFETWDVGLANELRAKGRYIFRYLRTVLMR